MRLLLDTHSFIWFMGGDLQFPGSLKSKIEDRSNKCMLSIASVWEMAIKTSLGKLELKGEFNKIADFLIENDIESLPVSFEHIQQLLKLPFHHRDPFDRLIIAQALVEDFSIATKDEKFLDYGIDCIWG